MEKRKWKDAETQKSRTKRGALYTECFLNFQSNLHLYQSIIGEKDRERRSQKERKREREREKEYMYVPTMPRVHNNKTKGGAAALSISSG